MSDGANDVPPGLDDDGPSDATAPRRMSRPRLVFLLGALVVVVAALVLVAIPVVSGIVDSQPHRYTSASYGFSVTFPGKPTVKTPAGASGSRLYVAWQRDGASLIVQGTPLTAAEKATAASSVVDDRLTNAASLFDKTHPAITSTTVGGRSARQASFSLGDPDRAREVAFIQGGRLYTIIMVNATSAQQKTFLASFALRG